MYENLLEIPLPSCGVEGWSIESSARTVTVYSLGGGRKEGRRIQYTVSSRSLMFGHVHTYLFLRAIAAHGNTSLLPYVYSYPCAFFVAGQLLYHIAIAIVIQLIIVRVRSKTGISERTSITQG